MEGAPAVEDGPELTKGGRRSGTQVWGWIPRATASWGGGWDPDMTCEEHSR